MIATTQLAIGNFQKPPPVLASSPPSQNLKFEREDWSLFRTVEGLQQKAGVAKHKLFQLVLKELTDNGLDEGAEVRVGSLPGGGYFIEDDGRGIDGTPEAIAQLFSIARPMISTKLLRLPTRGALGNGLRVVAGAVLASAGSLVVVTRGRRIAFSHLSIIRRMTPSVTRRSRMSRSCECGIESKYLRAPARARRHHHRHRHEAGRIPGRYSNRDSPWSGYPGRQRCPVLGEDGRQSGRWRQDLFGQVVALVV
jgi:hypothetical protein